MEKAVERGLDWVGLPVIATRAARVSPWRCDGPCRHEEVLGRQGQIDRCRTPCAGLIPAVTSSHSPA